MRRSNIRNRLRIPAFLLLGIACTAGALGQTLLAGSTRFVDVIELTDHDDQADIVVQFTCSLRYITHLPESEGTELRIQLRALTDCGVNPAGQLAGELPPVSGGANILAAARVESDIPGQITLVLSWRKSERFVLLQGADLRGLRIRLIDRAGDRGKVIVSPPLDAVGNFAVNLESQPKPFTQEAIDLASQRLKMPAYVSEAVVDEQKWFRLRVGPIERQSDATSALNQALAEYPRAWIAFADDAETTDADAATAAPAVTIERMGADPALAPAVLKQLMVDARKAMAARDYPTAIRDLTKLQRQPEFPERADMQELLGLTHERAGQLAQAKAEYEEYLRRYPQGAAASRIRERLRVLRTAALNGRDAGLGEGEATSGWQVTGGVGQLFRYDGTHIASSVTSGSEATGTAQTSQSTQSTSLDALYNDVDVLARRRGERLNVVGRFSGGYTRDFSSDGVGNLTRVSLASVDLTDTAAGLDLRVGRQTRNEDGVLGTFDGALLSYQFLPAWNVSATFGYPVERTEDGVKTDRRLEALSLGLAPPGAHWDASVFAASQQFEGLRDRRATGFDARYLSGWLSVAGLFDYDVDYHSLNAAALLGTLQLPARWNVSVDAERRNAPVLTTSNALIGEPLTTIAELQQIFSDAEIYQLARDRTPVSSNYALTVTHPLGERYQFAATAAATEIGATVASGGVDATASTGLETSYQLQLYGSGLWARGDFHVLSLAHAKTEIGLIDSAGLTSRFPVGGAWRLGVRGTLERRQIVSDNSTDLDFLPSFLLDFQRGRALVQLELGGELGRRDATLESQNSRRYYASAAYRIAF
jgi:hypothetical protein